MSNYFVASKYKKPEPSLFVNTFVNSSVAFMLLCVIYVLSPSLQYYVSTCH